MSSPAVPAVDPSDIPSTATLLDVREDDEWAAGHAPQAVHVPMSALPARVDEVPDGPVAVVCRAGGRSAQVVAYLRSRGHDATNVAGGMQAWEFAGLPLAPGGDGPARVL